MKKVLFIVPLSPPIHGASVINDQIKKSKNINKKFETFFIDSSPGKNIADVGSFKFYKLYLFIIIYFNIFFKIMTFKPNIIYFNPSPIGVGFYKDILIISLIKLFDLKLIFHMHGKGFQKQAIKSFFKRKLLNYAFKNINIICLSKSLIKDINLIRDKTKKISIINNFSKKLLINI